MVAASLDEQCFRPALAMNHKPIELKKKGSQLTMVTMSSEEIQKKEENLKQLATEEHDRRQGAMLRSLARTSKAGKINPLNNRCRSRGRGRGRGNVCSSNFRSGSSSMVRKTCRLLMPILICLIGCLFFWAPGVSSFT
jgi:hypothetical protein